MTRLEELTRQKDQIEFANNCLRMAAANWTQIVGLDPEDTQLAADYVKDMISDTAGVRLRRIEREIAELTEDESRADYRAESRHMTAH